MLYNATEEWKLDITVYNTTEEWKMDILNIMPQKSGNGHFKWIFKWINVEQNLETRENHQVVSLPFNISLMQVLSWICV